MRRSHTIRWAFLATLLAATSCFAGALDTAGSNKGVSWLTQQRNADDGSWGASDVVKYVQTAYAVIALSALNQQGTAYYGGVNWLGNHAPTNIDFTAHRVLALGAANHFIVTDLQIQQAAQMLTATGNNVWGLSSTGLCSPPCCRNSL